MNKLTPQCKKILDLLQDGYWHSGGEIYDRTKVIKYSTRISDLRVKYGYNISHPPKFRDNQYWYKLFSKGQGKLFNIRPEI